MPSPDSFRTARWLRTINLVLQAVLFLTFFAGLNYLAPGDIKRQATPQDILVHQQRRRRGLAGQQPPPDQPEPVR